MKVPKRFLAIPCIHDAADLFTVKQCIGLQYSIFQLPLSWYPHVVKEPSIHLKYQSALYMLCWRTMRDLPLGSFVNASIGCFVSLALDCLESKSSVLGKV